MKAAVYTRSGPPEVLQVRDIEKPVPTDQEVLISVRAASVNPLDWRMLRGGPYLLDLVSELGKSKVKRAGVDVAGQVEAVGRRVTGFKPGDAVFGLCKGAFAEYACAAESAVALKPGGVTFEQAASAPVAALTALQGLRDKGHIQAGHQVLVNGASGGVGTFTVQIAKSFGAEVTGVCSTRNLDLVRSLGAHRAIDYTREDFTRGISRYDLIVDCVGNHSLSAFRRVLNARGTCVIAGAQGLWSILGRAIAAPVLSRLLSQEFAVFIAKSNQQDLNFIGELMATGKVTPVIDRRYKLGEIAEAVRYLQAGHARGKVVITLE